MRVDTRILHRGDSFPASKRKLVFAPACERPTTCSDIVFFRNVSSGLASKRALPRASPQIFATVERLIRLSIGNTWGAMFKYVFRQSSTVMRSGPSIVAMRLHFL